MCVPTETYQTGCVKSVPLESVFINLLSTPSPNLQFINSLAFRISWCIVASQITKTPACVCGKWIWRIINKHLDKKVEETYFPPMKAWSSFNFGSFFQIFFFGHQKLVEKIDTLSSNLKLFYKHNPSIWRWFSSTSAFVNALWLLTF